MKILDLYILKKFLSSFVFVVLILVSIICVIDFTEKNDDFMEHNLSWEQIAGYYADFVPYVANLITPITVFIATVFVTAKLASHTEIIAMLSSGISFTRLMVPYLIGAVIISITSFILTGWIIPNSNKDRIAFEVEYINSPFYFSERDIHIQEGPNSYLYMENYNNQANVGYKFTLETIEDKLLKEKLSARRIEWVPEEEKWMIEDWTLRKFDGFEEKLIRGEEMDTVLSIKPADFGSTKYLEQALTINELNDYIDKLVSRGASNVKVYLIEKYVRFMSPFSAIILTFIGLTVSSRKTRGGAGFQIALGFLIAFIFIVFFILSKNVAQSSSINPIIGVWIPNIVFSVIGFIMYKTVPR